MKDSVDKIITTYFSLMCDEPFQYKDKLYEPGPISVGESLLRGLGCPSGCGACCKAYTLDWLPDEKRHESAVPRIIEFNKMQYQVYSDLNNETEYYCKHLNLNDGRCGIHSYNPLSCDFEIIRLVNREKPYITSTYYGRGWNMLKVNGERGASCEIIDGNEEIVDDIKRRFLRLENWFNHFNLKSKIPTLIKWIDSDNHTRLVF